jgi:hypothetical protein
VGMKAYIISCDEEYLSENDLVSYLDTKREVLNWLIPMPNTIFIISKRDAGFIARLIRKKFPGGLFIVTQYNPDSADGLLAEDMWDFLNSPKEA